MTGRGREKTGRGREKARREGGRIRKKTERRIGREGMEEEKKTQMKITIPVVKSHLWPHNHPGRNTLPVSTAPNTAEQALDSRLYLKTARCLLGKLPCSSVSKKMQLRCLLGKLP